MYLNFSKISSHDLPYKLWDRQPEECEGPDRTAAILTGFVMLALIVLLYAHLGAPGVAQRL